MKLPGNTATADALDELDRRIDLLADEPAGRELTALDVRMLMLTGIVIPASLLLWGWA